MTPRPATPDRLAQDAAKLLAVYVRGNVPVRTVISGDRIIIEPLASQSGPVDPYDVVDMSR